MVVLPTSVISRLGEISRGFHREPSTLHRRTRCQLCRMLEQGAWGVTGLQQRFPLSALKIFLYSKNVL